MRHAAPCEQRRGQTGQHEGGVAQRPDLRLRVHGQRRLDQHGVRQQRQHRRQIRQRIQAVWLGAAGGGRERARVPRLHQRPRGRQQQVRRTDRTGQHRQHAPAGVFERHAFPARVGGHRQRGQAQHQQGDVHQWLLPGAHLFVQPVHIGITEQQLGLEEHDACAPHRGRSAKPRQDHLGDDGLDLKKQEGGEENGGREQAHPASITKPCRLR
jgi:hypothetical protein